jgi:hypothetical protein
MDGVLQQITGYTKFVQSQEGLLPPAVIAANMDGMVNSLLLQLGNIALTTANATLLNTAVSESKFSEEHKLKLATTIASRVSVAPIPTKKTQTLTAVLGYFTETDWAFFEDKAVLMFHKVGRLADRCRLLGLVNPSEATVKHLAAVIAVAHCPTGAPQELHQLVLHVKQSISSFKGSIQAMVTRFPDNPDELPQDVFAAAYPSDKPVTKKCPGFQAVLGKIPLRVSNKSVQQPMSAMPKFQQGPNVVDELLAMLGRRAPAVQLTPYGESIARSSNFSYTESPIRPAMPALLDAPSPPQTTGPTIHLVGTKPIATSPTPSIAAQAMPADEDTAEADDAVTALEAIAAKAAAKAAAKLAGKHASKRAGDDVDLIPKKRPAAAAHKKPAAAVSFGCSKCRGSQAGCKQCRDPGFGGRRFTA